MCIVFDNCDHMAFAGTRLELEERSGSDFVDKYMGVFWGGVRGGPFLQKRASPEAFRLPSLEGHYGH